MRFHSLAVIAFTVSCATLASAQNPGFFRPAADPNLTARRLAAEDRAPDAAQVLQWSERQMDRSEQEAQRAKPAPGTPAPINGAFTGSTNPRDR